MGNELASERVEEFGSEVAMATWGGEATAGQREKVWDDVEVVPTRVCSR